MNQTLISKDEIAQKLGVKDVTLREIFRFCQSNGYRLITHDRYFIIVEDLWFWDQRMEHLRCAQESLLHEMYSLNIEVNKVARHFKDY